MGGLVSRLRLFFNKALYWPSLHQLACPELFVEI